MRSQSQITKVVLMLALLTGSLSQSTKLCARAEESHKTNLQKGQDLWAQHKDFEAMQFFQAACKDDPKNYLPHHDIAFILGHHGRYAEAIPELKKTIELCQFEGNKSFYRHQLASYYAKTQNWTESIRIYETLVHSPYASNNPSVMNDLAAAYSMAGMFDKAQAMRKQAISYGQLDADPAAARFNALLKAGNREDAVKLGENTFAAGDRNVALLQPLAKELKREQQFDKAIKIYAEGCKRAPLNARLRGGKGECEAALGKYTEAFEDLSAALELPYVAEVDATWDEQDQKTLWYMNRMGCLAKIKGFPEALKQVNAAIADKSNAKDQQYLFTRAQLYVWKQDYPKALTDFAVVFKKDPKFQCVPAYLDLRTAHYMLNNISAAIADSKLLIKRGYDGFDALFILGELEMHQNQFKDAADDFGKATTQQRGLSILALERRADAHYLAGEYQAAAADYSTTIEIMDKNPCLFAGRALSYSKLDEREKADKDIESMKALNGKHSSELKWNSQSMFPDVLTLSILKKITERRKDILAEAAKLASASGAGASAGAGVKAP